MPSTFHVWTVKTKRDRVWVAGRDSMQDAIRSAIEANRKRSVPVEIFRVSTGERALTLSEAGNPKGPWEPEYFRVTGGML